MTPYRRMFASAVAVLFVLSAAVLLFRSHKSFSTSDSASESASSRKLQAVENYGRIPLSFEPVAADGATAYVARGAGYSVAVSATETTVSLRKAGKRGDQSDGPITGALGSLPRRFAHQRDPAERVQFKLKLEGANAGALGSAENELEGKANYLLGNDPSKWRTNVPTYASVRFRGVYEGIDLVYYGNQRRLEHDFVVAPGTDPAAIRMRLEGTDAARIDGDGSLVLSASGEEVRLEKPVVYQQIDGERQQVKAEYVLRADNKLGFAIGDYDTSRTLVIDPVLTYSTFLGGSGQEIPNGIAVDPTGNVYIAGAVESADFPVMSAFQPRLSGDTDIFVAKLNASGNALIYATYIGGSEYDEASGVAVDAAGGVTLVGGTDSSNFPVQNAYQSSLANPIGAGFVTRLNPNGSALTFSTYLNGNSSQFGFGDWVNAVAVDASGSAYVTGITDSRTFPTTANAYQRAVGAVNAFISKFDATGALVYSTYLGGLGVDAGNAIAVDGEGNAYVAGSTQVSAFPTVSAFQNVAGGGNCVTSSTSTTTVPCPDGFVAKLNPQGSRLLFSTYLGGSGPDEAYGIAVDSLGSAHVTGYTQAQNFPTSNGSTQRTFGGLADSFLVKLSPTGSALVYGTYLGGSSTEFAFSVAVSSLGFAYVAGQTSSADFPVMNPYQTNRGGTTDAFLAVFDPQGLTVFSTYMGGPGFNRGTGVAVDRAGSAYITGLTRSSTFPTVNALQSSYAGGTCGTPPTTLPCYDAFISKFTDPTQNETPALASLSPGVIARGGEAFTLTVNGSKFSRNAVVRGNGSDRPTTFVNSSRLTAAIPAADIAAAGTIQITVFNPAPGGGLSAALPFVVSAGGTAPTVPAGSTVNAAGLTAGSAVAAGSIATVFGSNLASATGGNVSVQMNGVNARIFDVFPGQINFQVPWELAGQPQASLTVTVDGVTSAPSTVNLAPFAPGIFLIGQQGAVLIATEGDTLAAPVGSIPGRVSRPAGENDYITIYCTGLGDVTNRPPSGTAASGNPLSATRTTPTVTIGGVNAPVTEFFFAGLSPGFIGLYQITVQVPRGVAPGNAVPLVISVGGVTSNTAMIAIR